MPYELLLFDLDDTLFDFAETEKHALHNTFTFYGIQNGVETYRPSFHAINDVIWAELETGQISLEDLKIERFRRLFDQYNLAIDPIDFGDLYVDNLGKESHLIDGVEDMLAGLTDYRLAVLTNGFTAAQNSRIARSPLHSTFEAIIASEETGFKKPQAEIFEYTFDKLGVSDPSRVLMIGDSLTSDIQGGMNAGIDTCWFNRRQFENHSFIQPTFEVQSWKQFSMGRQTINN